MALSAFPYVGGKTILSDWIISQLPEHNTYVEPFGGSASVLLNKPRSKIEAFNDLDGDIVQFFEIARDRPDELKQWVQRTPFSEELHSEYATDFYSGKRPDDPIERAGRFLFLRYSQYAGKYNSNSGFKRDTPRGWAAASSVWKDVDERIESICRRLQGVSIQNRHFSTVIEHYDSDSVLYYCDPPYLDKENTYRVDDFSHAELAEALEEIDGYAMVSYAAKPEGLYEGWTEVTQSHYHDAGARFEENEEEVTERLFCNFDPPEQPAFTSANQTTLGEVNS